MFVGKKTQSFKQLSVSYVINIYVALIYKDSGLKTKK